MSLRYLAFVLIVMIVVLLMFICPQCGKSRNVVHRKRSLQRWHQKVEEFGQQEGRQPRNLYEVFLYFDKKNTNEKLPVLIVRQLSDIEKEKIENDPSYFLRLIQYEFIEGTNGWQIKEKDIKAYGGLFMINQNGEIIYKSNND